MTKILVLKKKKSFEFSEVKNRFHVGIVRKKSQSQLVAFQMIEYQKDIAG
jgi:hypothetical protein